MMTQVESFTNLLDPNYKKSVRKSVNFEEDESNYKTSIKLSEKFET